MGKAIVVQGRPNKGTVLSHYCAVYWDAQHNSGASHQACKDYAWDQTCYAFGWTSDDMDKWLDRITQMV